MLDPGISVEHYTSAHVLPGEQSAGNDHEGDKQSMIRISWSFSTTVHAIGLHKGTVYDKDMIKLFSCSIPVGNSCFHVNIEALEPAACDSESDRGAEEKKALRVQ